MEITEFLRKKDQLGITDRELLILITLAKHGRMRIHECAEKFMMDSHHIQTAIAKLKKNRLILSTRDGHATYIELTGSGGQVVRTIYAKPTRVAQ